LTIRDNRKFLKISGRLGAGSSQPEKEAGNIYIITDIGRSVNFDKFHLEDECLVGTNDASGKKKSEVTGVSHKKS